MATETNQGARVAPVPTPPAAALDLHAHLGVPVLLARSVATLTPRGEVVLAIEHLADLLSTLDDADTAAVRPRLAELLGLDYVP
jgi:hypothetical protein